MRWMLLVAITLAACSRPTCEERVRSRMDADARWRELGPRGQIRGLTNACKDLDDGRKERIPDETLAKIECILAAEDTTAFDRCAKR